MQEHFTGLLRTLFGTPAMSNFKKSRTVNITDLIRDAEYQRPTSESRARRIAAQFDPDLFDAITVFETKVKGRVKYVVNDGLHRVRAAELAGYSVIPATVVEHKSVQRQAEDFGKKNRGQKSLTALETFHADVVARVQDALDVRTIANETGWSIGSDLRCITVVRVGYRKHGAETVTRALTVLRDVLPGQDLPAWAAGGVISFFGLHPEADDKRVKKILDGQWTLINKLRLRDREGDQGSATRGSAAMKIIFELYNEHLPMARKLEPGWVK
jgi:hypothetical protein